MQAIDHGALDWDTAPPDFATFYRQYHRSITNLVRRYGVGPTACEDIVADLMERILRNDYLGKFDPTRTFTYQGEVHTAKFRTFITRIVHTHMRGIIRNHVRRISHEQLVLDDVVGPHNDNPLPWIDVYGDHAPPAGDLVLTRLIEEDLVDYLRAFIAQVPRRSAYDSCDLVALFDAVVEQIRTDGHWDTTVLRHMFGIGATSINAWMWWLRENLADALGRPVPAKRPRTKRRPA